MNKLTMFVAGMVAATGLAVGAGTAAFASSGPNPPTTGSTAAGSATHTNGDGKHHKINCDNIAKFDTTAHAKLDKINDRIAKLEKYRDDHATELAKHPDKLARINHSLVRLHKAADRLKDRIAKVDAFCARQTSNSGVTPAP